MRAIYDALLGYQKEQDVSHLELSDYRTRIDPVDDQILISLFPERMDVAEEVAAYKNEHHLPILNQQRERRNSGHGVAQPEAATRSATPISSIRCSSS